LEAEISWETWIRSTAEIAWEALIDFAAMPDHGGSG